MAALLCPAATKEPLQVETATEDDDLPVNRPRLIRELLVGGSALLVGLLVAPLLIYLLGHSSLGPYAHGGLGRLLADYFAGLARGAPVFWAIAVGPYVMTVVVRVVYGVIRRRD
jgi:hypothetical protein